MTPAEPTVTVGELAEERGWSYKHAWKLFRKVEREHGCKAIVRVGKRRGVGDMHALKSALHLFPSADLEKRVREQGAKLARLEQESADQSRRIDKLVAQLVDVKRMEEANASSRRRVVEKFQNLFPGGK